MVELRSTKTRALCTKTCLKLRELEIARRKKRWRIKEAQIRAERSRCSDPKGTNGVASASTSSSQPSHSDVVDGEGPHIADEDKTLQQLFHDPSMKSRQPRQVRRSCSTLQCFEKIISL
jgi:hypothetical protein